MRAASNLFSLPALLVVVFSHPVVHGQRLGSNIETSEFLSEHNGVDNNTVYGEATRTLGTLVIVGDEGNPSSKFPLGLCEGDCDVDNDCAGSLVCFQRPNGGPKPPGCNGVAERSRDYCYNPSNGNSLVYVGNNGLPSSKFPMNRCEGDCDRDRECAGSLKCFQRNARQQVPGCDGNGFSGKDFCYEPTDATDSSVSAPDPNAFRLRLFWKKGYFWQETSKETFWCMECEGGSCNHGDIIRIKKCDRQNTRFHFVNPSGRGRQIRVSGTNLCFAVLNRRGILRLHSCDESKSNQRWEAELGSFDSFKFDIRPILYSGRCMTQHHHPKSNEEVGLWTCAKAHRYHTGYWNKY